MKSWIRASASLSLLWATVWGATGLVIGLGIWLKFVGAEGSLLDLLGAGAAYAVPFALQGGLWGLVFALLLARSERGRTFNDLTVRRVAILGLIGGAVAGLIYVGLGGLAIEGSVSHFLTYSALFGTLGAATASMSLAAARRGMLTPPAEMSRLPAP
jgi:hypothetical protein